MNLFLQSFTVLNVCVPVCAFTLHTGLRGWISARMHFLQPVLSAAQLAKPMNADFSEFTVLCINHIKSSHHSLA